MLGFFQSARLSEGCALVLEAGRIPEAIAACLIGPPPAPSFAPRRADGWQTGIFVRFEGWLGKKTQRSIAGRKRWQLKWFSIVTKETHGLVDSRTMQYYEEKPPDGCDTDETTFRNLIEIRLKFYICFVTHTSGGMTPIFTQFR